MTKILVIEDETILREEIIQWLSLEDYEAYGASDGLEGVKVALQEHPDLIICDITMPRLDGYGVLLELRADPAMTTTPFIFVTARAAHEDIRKGMDAGADDYITKPFTREELLSAIQSRLAKKTMLEQKHETEVGVLREVLGYEQERQMFKTRLVAMFSHDFRNPLASILSSNSLLRNYAHRMDAEKQQMHFKRIEASGRQLIQMLDDMLIVARIETGNLELKLESLNIEELLQNIVDEFRAIHGENYKITFNSYFNQVVTADAVLLRQITTNLLSNAVKYSPQHSEVILSLDYRDGLIVLTVQDQGIGIPEAEQRNVFKSFQRASNVGNVSGTGLGLAIVKQAVDLYGGSIYLESGLEKGTAFRVELPAQLPG